MNGLGVNVVTRSPEETRALGAELAGTLEPGDVVALYGDLGSGKTCLAQGICAGLAVAGPVTSPTFILINEYRGVLRGATIPVYHLDLYRLRSPEELENLGAEEYLCGQGVSLVEWAERAGDLLPSRRYEASLEYVDVSERRIHIRPPSPLTQG
ncbi:MAG: tRNA (adenosine(37)-N6)-threonylcarbamoyltransferase complex ATPase subunit type 1 TsaE [Candidatus Latescibacterota bacterium]